MEHALLEADAPRTCIITGHCRARTVPSIKYYCSVASTAPRGRAQTIGLLLFWYPALTFPSSLAHANERGRETREASHGGAVSTCGVQVDRCHSTRASEASSCSTTVVAVADPWALDSSQRRQSSKSPPSRRPCKLVRASYPRTIRMYSTSYGLQHELPSYVIYVGLGFPISCSRCRKRPPWL